LSLTTDFGQKTGIKALDLCFSIPFFELRIAGVVQHLIDKKQLDKLSS
jgi:hypothetical protein